MQILLIFLSLFYIFSSFPFVLFSPRVSYFFSFCLFSPCVVLCAPSPRARLYTAPTSRCSVRAFVCCPPPPHVVLCVRVPRARTPFLRSLARNFIPDFSRMSIPPVFYADKKAEKGRKKRARVSSHPKCLHIGIILIVYVIQKSCAKILLFYEICKYFNK